MRFRAGLTVLLTLMLIAASSVAQAQATIDVIMDTAATLGGGGGNPANGGIFQSSTPAGAPIAVGGVTTSVSGPNFWSNSPSPNSVTYTATDSATGATFSFDVVIDGYENNNGTISLTNLRDVGCCSAGVDSTLPGEQNSEIDSAARLAGNNSEFLRVTVDNINVINPGSLTEPLDFLGFFGATIRTGGDSTDAGDILEAGAGNVMGTNILAVWDNSAFRQTIDWDGISPLAMGLDIFATGDKAALQGLRLRFQEAQAAAVPEPASIAIWCVLGLALMGMGVYRVRRTKKNAG